MPTTITTFNIFTAGAIAVSGEVNTNFSNFRGDLLPIDVSVAAATTGVYDLGSSDYRFLNSYNNTLNLKGSPLLSVTGDSSFLIASSQTAATMQINFGGSLTNGVVLGGVGGFTASGEAFAIQTLTTAWLTIASLVLNIKPNGGPILLSIVHSDGGFTTDGYSLFGAERDQAASGVDSWQCVWYRQTAGSGAGGVTSGIGAFQNIGDNVSDIECFNMYGGFCTIDHSATADTEWTYWFAMKKLIGTQDIRWKSLNVKFIAKELL